MLDKLTEINLQQYPETNITTSQTDVSASFNLTCFQMWKDGIKASKLSMDPLSDCLGAALGTVCCIAVAAVNAEEDRKTPATRYDVVHAKQIQRKEAAEASCAFSTGYCVANAMVDTLSVIGGVLVGGARAAFFTCTGNNASTNTVFGRPRDDIKDVEIFDSCLSPACCQ